MMVTLRRYTTVVTLRSLHYGSSHVPLDHHTFHAWNPNPRGPHADCVETWTPRGSLRVTLMTSHAWNPACNPNDVMKKKTVFYPNDVMKKKDGFLPQ